MKDKQELCINCTNCIIYKQQYMCDYELWKDKKLNEIVIFLPVMFDCDNYEEYKGNNNHLKD